ncbi:hypothetical protein PCANC_16091 [Puccinia coronata f. sp. avenae]|uniref:Uncharacterized protein n=1 Tax=Puccinia coronata f. sp. avenae TaxID=200324 RepID=A0A2N5SF57_9BASI|nr:hypothetical protein PCANC_22240 [Puccinia coronata f. sp. avenae]PLW27732.1 hypothetical protein PCASD_20591 [Puccinia coronata f. sp. avenae]PLW36022.1 hypothetical protein PCANC_16091 [Puccinia coronata f. sp. avenae]
MELLPDYFNTPHGTFLEGFEKPDFPPTGYSALERQASGLDSNYVSRRPVKPKQRNTGYPSRQLWRPLPGPFRMTCPRKVLVLLKRLEKEIQHTQALAEELKQPDRRCYLQADRAIQDSNTFSKVISHSDISLGRN